MALPDLLKTDMGGISPLIDSARAPKETPQSLVKIPAAPKFGEDDTGTMKAQIGAGQQRLDKSYAEQERLLGETGNLTTQLAQYAANLVSYRNEQEVFKANQQKETAKADSEIITKMLNEIRGGPLYKQKQETNKQIAEYSAFVPTEVTAPMLGVLFATIGATGMLLGGNSKNTAKAALSAMNGMAEGFGKGREQYDKERKQAFDSNVKLLQTKLSAINDGLEEARKEAILNKQAAELKVRETLAANEAQFLQENTNRRGLESTIELVKGQLASLNKSLELQKTKTNQIESQLQRQSDNLYLKQLTIQSAQAMQQDRIAAQITADERRARERQEDIRLTASLRQPPAPRVGIQDGQMVQLPDPRTLPAANVAAPISSVTAGEKKGATGKPPPKEILLQVNSRDTLIPALKELLPTLDRLNREGKYNELAFALNSPTGAEWYFRDDIEAIKAIRILAKFRSGEFETAGKALTKKEDDILRPLYQAANRPYVAVKNAVEEGLKELTQQNKNYKNAYPDFYSRQSVPETPLAQRMDQVGATPGTSVADIRSKAQEKILEINNRTDLDQAQKQELVRQISSLYKQKTGTDL
jgi:hypothetical protein